MIAYTILVFLVGGCIGLISGIAQGEQERRQLKRELHTLRNDVLGTRLREQAAAANHRLTTKT